jgi:Uma2 family endonuclease
MGVAISETFVGRMSGSEFRSFQERRPDRERWELVAGVPMMMTPPTIAHNRIASNLERLLNDALDLRDPSRIAVQRPGIELGSGDYRPEPDIGVIDADYDENQRFVARAYLLAEIVSGSDDVPVPGTRERWIEVKRQIYLAHDACEALLIVQQGRIEAQLDLSTTSGWKSATISGPSAELNLPAFGLKCLLGQVYAGTPLQPRAGRQHRP